ncbi:MAG: hypothetical protein EB127_05570 [Alphaproteobacteria bacterium]|nr:hypothetical protein [Alphaproteobacteria bacterium]
MTNQEICIRLAKSYYCKSTNPTDLDQVSMDQIAPITYEHSPIPWFLVGHNSSHQFYLGVDANDNLYRHSYACEKEVDTSIMSVETYYSLLRSGNEEDEMRAMKAEKWVEHSKITPIAYPNFGYMGHF